ncbi:MAG TPA: flagellar biosynthetic protein FliO [Candidatus Acidoferrum sp.]|jgi:flagellar biogenesis protein FliO|nr:flagellar biosynthetic protein FliO [Candidatus Acidoferrum sp.]
MPWSFWEAYAVKLLILGLVLAALYAVARRLKGARFFARGVDRYVTVIESTMLSQQAAVHLLRVGTRYLLIGGGNAGLFKLAEFSAGELEVP